jgi:hypothetical protein
MSILLTFLPIGMVLFLAVLLFLMINRRVKFVTVKITHWLLSIYTGVLLLATAFVPFILDDTIRLEKVNQEDIDRASSNFYAKISQGKIARIDKKYIAVDKSFDDYQSQTLRVASSSEYVPQVFVERKTSDDDKIEAYIFDTGLIIDGIDLSENLKRYKVQLIENTLTIIPPEEQNIKISMARDDFPIRQFTGESIISDTFTSRDTFVYLRIPEDIEIITDDDMYLEYIEE